MDPEALEASEVMARYCRGEAAAFDRLYQMMASRVLAYLVGLLGDKAAAEDVLQQAFLKVHQARGSYVLGANPIPWIYAIAHRTALDEIRRRKRSRVRLTVDGELRHPPAAGTGVAALEQLPENQREALILTKVHGRSVAEAAMITGSTPGAIKQRAHRAYVSLRGILKRGGAGDEGAPAMNPARGIKKELT